MTMKFSRYCGIGTGGREGGRDLDYYHGAIEELDVALIESTGDVS